MANDDIFTQTDQADVNPQPDPNKNYLEELVGEGKKFSDPQALARGKVEADTHIARLERELAELREKANTGRTVDDLLKKLEERNTQSNGNASNSGEYQPSSQGQNQNADAGAVQLDESKIEELLSGKLNEFQKSQREQANLQHSVSVMQEKWGDNAQVELNRKAKDLGMSPEGLKEYAKTNPSVFLTLVGLNATAPQQTVNNPVPAQSSSNPASQTPVGGVKNQSYYDRMKREDPKKWKSRDVQWEMHNEAIRQGEAFFS